MKKHIQKIVKKTQRIMKYKMHSHVIPFTIALSLLLSAISLTILGKSVFSSSTSQTVRPYQEPHANMSAHEIFKLGTEAFRVYLENQKNEEAFDNACDYFGVAFTRNKNQNPLEALIAQEYLVILSALHSARRGHANKYREEASDKLRVARDKLIAKKHEVAINMHLSSKQKYNATLALDNAINLLLQTMLHLSKEEGVYTKKRIYLGLAQETTEMLSHDAAKTGDTMVMNI